MHICTENSFILNSFGVHMIWIISVLSLMPKGEIVGIKLVLPSVTTLSNISDSTELRAIQCLPGNTVSTGLYSVYRAPGYAVSTELRVPQCLPSLQWSPSIVGSSVVTEYSTEHSVYRGTVFTESTDSIQYSPSQQTGTVFTE